MEINLKIETFVFLLPERVWEFLNFYKGAIIVVVILLIIARACFPVLSLSLFPPLLFSASCGLAIRCCAEGGGLL